MSAYTERLNYFKSTILPFILKKDQTGILLYVEEYYDYINIRNLMMDEVLEEDVAVINEYSFSFSLDCQDICPPMSAWDRRLISRTEQFVFFSIRVSLVLPFFHSFLGRYHYFRRYPVHGVNTIFFIGVPREPSLYGYSLSAYL